MFKVIQKRSGRAKLYAQSNEKQKRQRQIFLFAMFLVGLIIGTLTVRNGDKIIPERVYMLIQYYMDVKKEQSVWLNFNNVFLKRVLLLLFVYCTGVCALGAPALYLTPTVYGVGVGVVSGYLYAAFALKGIGCCALMLYPGEILFITALIPACATGIEMTGKILHHMSGAQDLPDLSLREYSARFGIILLLCAVSAVLETAMFALFSGYFQFS